MKEPFFQAQNMTAYQGDTQVFENFDITIPHRQNIALLGPNGCGKSTLLKLIFRELYPVHNDPPAVLINGQAHWNVAELRQDIGLVSHSLYQTYHRQIKGFEVVASGFFNSIDVHEKLSPAQRQATQVALDQYDLSELSHKRMTELSSGQRQKLLLARALVHQPKILILDEPTNHLDPAARANFIATLRQVATTGVQLLLVTHQLSEVIPEFNRVVLLNAGRVVADGSRALTLTSQNLSRTFNYPLIVDEHHHFYYARPA